MAVALVILFALRALVPQGYMLSPEALADGALRVVVCDGYGTKLVSVDAGGKILDDREHPPQHRVPCDFALASLIGHTPPAQGEILAVAARTATPSLEWALFAPLAVQGPPLGSRAPPAPTA